jgi:hypothetical protein
MKKSRRVSKKHIKRRKTNRKIKGGDCGCGANKTKQSVDPMFGGYGAASYQGGINGSILPLNTEIGTRSDPMDAANIQSGRFIGHSGGKRKQKKTRGGFTVDPLLGNSLYTNPVLNAGTSFGAANMSRTITGQSSMY